jgi:GAF domain-containing protein
MTPRGTDAAHGAALRRPARAGHAPATRSAQADRLARVVTAFGEVAEALAAGEDLDTLIDRIVRRVSRLTGVSRCTLYLADPDYPGLFRGRAGWSGDTNLTGHVRQLVAGVAADGFTREIVDTRAPVLVSDALHDPRPVRSAMRTWGVRAMLGLPMLLGDEIIGIVYLDDTERTNPFDDQTVELGAAFASLAAVAIAQARANDEVRGHLVGLARQNEQLRRIGRLDDRLDDIALRGAGITEIAAATGREASRPCAIHDERGELLATDDAAHPTGSFPTPSATDPARTGSYAAALAAVDAAPAIIGPFPGEGLTTRYLVAPVHESGRRIGHVALAERGSRFSAVDVHLARRAATHIALDAAARRRAAAADEERRRHLVADLLRTGTAHEAIRLRAASGGLRDDLDYVVALLTPTGTDAGSDVIRRAAAQLRAADQLAIVGASTAGAGIAIVLPAPTDGTAALRRDLTSAIADLGAPVQLAVSAPRPLSGLPAALREAERVAACQRTFAGARTPVLCADELGVAQLYLANTRADDALQFALDTLGPIADDPAEATLLETLLAHAEAGGSVRATAERQGVHENTVRYRLARTAELTGLDVLGDDADRATARTAAVILRLAGRHPGQGR